MSGSQEEAMRNFYDQLDRFSSFWVQKRVFSRWKEHHVDTKQRIQKIIQSMDLNEKWILKYHISHWKTFVQLQHQKRAKKLRKIYLAKRVVKQWKRFTERNKLLTLFKYFNLIRKYYVESKIEKVIREKKNYKVMNGIFQHMKDYSIYSFQREMRMHEKCSLFYKRNLKKKYFNSLKLSAKIKRDVEYMRSTALESRRFYLFKSFFLPWKEITQKRKINRCCYLILQQQNDLKRKSSIFYTWIHSSIKNYQVRVFTEKNLLLKYFRVLQTWYIKQSKKKYQLEYFTQKKVDGFRKLILLEWFQYANRKVVREKKCKAYILKRKQMLIEKCFFSFKKVCDKQIKKERLIYYSMKHYQISTLKKCFENWAMYLEEKQALYLNRLEANRHCEKMLQRLYFKTLKVFIFKKKFLRDVEAQIELRKIQREKSTMFSFMKSRMLQNQLIQNKVYERYNFKKQAQVFEELKSYAQLKLFQKACVKQNVFKMEQRLKEKGLLAWAFRSNQNRLPRYQNKEAKTMREIKLYQKSFLTLKKRWMHQKLGSYIKKTKEMALERNAFYLWSYLKAQEERINRNIIGLIINKSYRMFYQLKDYALRKKKNREIITHLKEKRNYRIQKLGWSVWKFFIKLNEEKSMYKMSLLRFALTKRAKKMLAAWNNRVIQRHKEEELSVKIKECQQKWRKTMLLRCIKEGASGELDFINLIRNFRAKKNLKVYRKIFNIWTEYTEKKSIIKRIIQQNREVMNYRLMQNILVEWQYSVQMQKRDNLKLEEHIQFKQCVQIANILKYWRRLTKVLAKENQKVALIKNTQTQRLEYNYFYAWCDVYQEKRFREQTEKMQIFLQKKIAFNSVIRALRTQYNKKQVELQIDTMAIRHYIQGSLRKTFESWKYHHQQQKRKRGLNLMTNLLAKAIAMKRVVKKFKIMKNYAFHRKHCFKYYITKLYHKCFYVLKQYQQFRQNQRLLANKQYQSLQLQKIQKCFLFLKRNVDLQADQRMFSKKFDKKRTFRLKKLSMLIWKDYYMKKRFENGRINEFVETKKNTKLRSCFTELHRYRLNKTFMKACKETALTFNTNRVKRGFFNSWKYTCNKEQLKVRQSNMAFVHYSQTLLSNSLRQWIRFIYEEKRENNQTFNGVALRSVNLKQQAFHQLKKYYTLQTKFKIVHSNHKLIQKSLYLRKWKKNVIKNKLSKPAIEVICTNVNKAIKRTCFNKIYSKSNASNVLSKIARIYSHNLNYNVLKVFLVNMLKQRRAENYQMHKNFQLAKSSFDVLKQYAEIKKRRVFKVVQTLQNIHGILQFNLAQKVFYAFKQYHYMRVLKRNTLIRYMNQLKLKTFLSLRKYVIEVNEQGRNESRITAVHM